MGPQVCVRVLKDGVRGVSHTLLWLPQSLLHDYRQIILSLFALVSSSVTGDSNSFYHLVLLERFVYIKLLKHRIGTIRIIFGRGLFQPHPAFQPTVKKG